MVALVDKTIQQVSTTRDSTGMRFITLTYATEAEAKAAREKIEETVANVVEAYIAP
jgi:hypothetical protein